jgi:hypothetical protein
MVKIRYKDGTSDGIREWRDISTAPKDGSRIHLGYRAMEGFDVIAHWMEGEWRLSGTVGLKGRPEPTHWMPLPKSP